MALLEDQMPEVSWKRVMPQARHQCDLVQITNIFGCFKKIRHVSWRIGDFERVLRSHGRQYFKWTLPSRVARFEVASAAPVGTQ